MSGVFLSYSRADRAIADQIIRGLRAVGIDAWWDEDMRGVDWQKELEQRIGELGGVMVLWTASSSNSNHVRDEARLALDSDKLINALWEVPKPPFPYDRVNGLPLDGWTGREPHRGWTRLIETIDEMFARSTGGGAGAFVDALTRRERAVHAKEEAVARAQEAFRDAQTRSGEAEETAKAASAALAHADEDLSRVVELRVGSTILRSAQQQLDAAHAASDDAIAAERAARAQLSEASRAVTRASAELDDLLAEAAGPTGARQPPSVADPPEAAGRPIAATSSAATNASGRSPPRQPSPAQWVGAGGVLLAVLVVGTLVLSHRPNATGSASAAASAKPEPVDPTAQAVQAAAALAGTWADAGSGCPGAYTIAVQQGAVLLSASGATSTATIDPSPQHGVISAHAGDGRYTYTLEQGGGLAVAGPGGVSLKLIRCAG